MVNGTILGENNKKNYHFSSWNNDYQHLNRFEKSIKFFLASRGEYFWYLTSVNLLSIIKNHSDNFVEIIIFYSNTSPNKINKFLKKIKKYKNVFLHFISIENDTNALNYRFYIFKENFKNIDKIFHIDSDALVLKNLKIVYDLDLKEKCFVGVKDYIQIKNYFLQNPYKSKQKNFFNFLSNESSVKKNIKDVWKIYSKLSNFYLQKDGTQRKTWLNFFIDNVISVDINNYINAGFFLVDLEKVRKLELDKQLLNFDIESYIFYDQDFLNEIFKNHIHHIESKYNYFSHYTNKAIKQELLQTSDFQDFDNDSIYIYHYTNLKPNIWKKDKSNYFDSYFFYIFNKLWRFEYIKKNLILKIIFFPKIFKKIFIIILKNFNIFIKNNAKFFLNYLKNKKALKVLRGLNKKNKNAGEIKTTKKNILFFMDTQNTLGDNICILHTLFNLNNLLNKNITDNFCIDVVATKRLMFLIDKISWNPAINFVYKDIDTGNQYVDSCFNEEKIKGLKKLSYQFSNKEYDDVFYMLPILTRDPLFILNSVKFKNIYRVNLDEFKGRNYDDKMGNFFGKLIWEKIENKTIYLENWEEKHSPIFVWNFLCSYLSSNNLIKIDTKNSEFEYLKLKNELSADNKEIIITCSMGEKDERSIDIDFLISLLNFLNMSFLIQVNFVGSCKNTKDIDEKLKKCNFKFLNLINKTNNEQLFESIKNSNLIFTHDSGVFHTSVLLDKKTVIFINRESRVVKMSQNFWLDYNNKNTCFIKLAPDLFNYDTPTKYEYKYSCLFVKDIVDISKKVKNLIKHIENKKL